MNDNNTNVTSSLSIKMCRVMEDRGVIAYSEYTTNDDWKVIFMNGADKDTITITFPTCSMSFTSSYIPFHGV